MSEEELAAKAAAEEAKAEEEFVSAPEDTLENPLVPESAENGEDSLAGTISSGNLETDFAEEKSAENNEENLKAQSEADVPVEESVEAVDEVEQAPAVETIRQKGADEPNKKSRKGLVIGLIISFVVLIGAAVAGFFIWLAIRETPETALNDAITNVVKAENIKFDGNYETVVNGEKRNISFAGSKVGEKLALNGTMSGKANGIDGTVDFSAIFVSGDEIYVKLDKLADLTKEIKIGDLLSPLMGSEMADFVTSTVTSIAETIDGNWVKLSVKDIEGFNGSLGKTFGALNGALSSDVAGALTDIYKNNQFLSVNKDAEVKEEDGAKMYSIDVDITKRDSFEKELKNNDKTSEFVKSFLNEKPDGAIYDTDSEDDIKRNSSSTELLPKTSMALGIKPFSHELTKVHSTTETTNEKSTIDANLSYGNGKIDIPAESKSIDELGKTIDETASKAFMTWYEEQVDKACRVEMPNSVEACKTASMKQLEPYMTNGTISISKMLEMFGIKIENIFKSL